MEPSRQTAARRRRTLRARSRELDILLGPDEAKIVHTFDDGWTVCRVTRLPDQLREGELMGNCLRRLTSPDPNCWSLRDTDNLPHATFTAWTIEPDDDLTEIPDACTLTVFLRSRQALLMVDATRPLKPAYRHRLVEFSDSDAATSAPSFPSDTRGRIREAARALDPGYVVHHLSGETLVPHITSRTY